MTIPIPREYQRFSRPCPARPNSPSIPKYNQTKNKRQRKQSPNRTGASLMSGVSCQQTDEPLYVTLRHSQIQSMHEINTPERGRNLNCTRK